jgi:hypothetical protein
LVIMMFGTWREAQRGRATGRPGPDDEHLGFRGLFGGISVSASPSSKAGMSLAHLRLSMGTCARFSSPRLYQQRLRVREGGNEKDSTADVVGGDRTARQRDGPPLRVKSWPQSGPDDGRNIVADKSTVPCAKSPRYL